MVGFVPSFSRIRDFFVWFRNGLSPFVMVSYGFGRFRPVFVGSGPHFLEKRVQEIKSFFFQFSAFFHLKKKIF